MRHRILMVGGMVLLLAGCGSDHHGAATTTTTNPPSATTAINPDVVPPVITAAYVNAVLMVLIHVYDNASRTLATARQVTPSAARDLRAVFNDPAYGMQLQAADLAVREGVIRNVRPRGGDAVVTVRRLISASATCVFVEAESNVTALFIHPTPNPASSYFALRPKQPGIDPTHLNKTLWAISYDAAYLAPTRVANQCAG